MRGTIAKRLRKVAVMIFIKDVKPELEQGADPSQLPTLRQIYKRLKRSYVKGY